MSENIKSKIILEAENRTKGAFQGVNREIKSLNENVKKSKKSFDFLKFERIVGGIKRVTREAYKLSKSGAEFESLSISFKRMTKDIGISSSELLKRLNEVSVGTISNKDLILSANKAMALGVGKDMGTMTDLMAIARLKAREMGLTTTQAFNDIVTGIGRSSPLILDNLGIVIKQEQAQRIYAESLGKTAKDLTDMERSQALLNAVLKQGNEQVKKAGHLTTTTKETMEQWNKTITDIKDLIGVALLPVMRYLIELLKPVISSIKNWLEKNPELAKSIAKIISVLGVMLLSLGVIGKYTPFVTGGFVAFNKALLFFITPIGLVVVAIALLVLGLIYLYNESETAKKVMDLLWKGIKEGVNSVIETFKSWWNFILEWGKKFFGFVGRALDWLSGIVEKVKNKFNAFKEALMGVVGYIKNSALRIFDAIYNKIEKIVGGVKKAIDWLKKLKSKVSSAYKKGVSNFKYNVTHLGEFTSQVGGNIKNNLGFANGGIVNAPLGQPVSAIVHGGEKIIPSRNVGRENSSVNININGGIFTDERGAREIADKVVDILKTEMRF